MAVGAVATSLPESRSAATLTSRVRAPSRPMLRLAFALALGSAWGVYGSPSRELLLLLASALAAGWISWRSALARDSPTRAIARAPLGLGLLALIVILAALRAVPEPSIRWSPALTAWEGVWRTRREEDADMRGTLAAVGAGKSSFEVPRGCVRDGEQIRILRGAPPAPPARGPVGGSMEARSASDAATAPRVVVAESDEILRLAMPRESAEWIAPLRARLEQRAEQLVDRDAASLARAFLLGDESALDMATADLFTRNGLRHVLAVSGWHVAMMAWLIVHPFTALAEMLAGKFPRRRRAFAWLSMLASVALCIAYVPLTGGGAPVRRSAIAVALASTLAFWPEASDARGVNGGVRTGVRFTRRIDALSLWAAALSVECWLDPAAVSEVAVQLSYAATLGLIVATRPLTLRMAESLGMSLSSRPRELLYSWPRQCAVALMRRCVHVALSGVAASIGAVLATAPIVWLTFGELCPWGVVTTPLLAPLFAALFATGMLMLAVPIGLFGALFTLSSRALLGALEAVDRLPGTPALLPDRPGWLIWGTLAAAWLLLRQKRCAGRIASGVRAAGALGAAALLLPWTPTADDFELHILDVGHGTCAVFRAPGESCWIFDCGSRDRSRVAQDGLGPLLRAWDVTAPKIVLSHTDSDHAGGLRWTVERTPPSLWAGALTAPLAERLPHTCPRLDLSEGAIELPEKAPGLKITLLRGGPWAGNEGSRSLLLLVHGMPVLLSGDAEEQGLAALLRGGMLKHSGGALLAPHHGSDAGYLGELLDVMEPSLVWVSTSTRPDLALELNRRGISWESTATQGPLSWRPP